MFFSITPYLVSQVDILPNNCVLMNFLHAFDLAGVHFTKSEHSCPDALHNSNN